MKQECFGDKNEAKNHGAARRKFAGLSVHGYIFYACAWSGKESFERQDIDRLFSERHIFDRQVKICANVSHILTDGTSHVILTDEIKMHSLDFLHQCVNAALVVRVK